MFPSLRSSCLGVLILASTAGLAQTPRAMTLVDMINLPQVSDPQLAPDGRQIVFVESEANWKADRRISHIWRVNADGSDLMEMTSGADGENSPRWSPDGKTIAFVAKRGAEPDSVNQIFLISIAGGEARPLTTHATAVSGIEWSPDGTTIYFRAADPKSEEEKAREKLKEDVFMFDEDFKQQHLWSVAVAGRAEHRITQGDYSVLSYELSEDGRKIAFHRAPSPQIGDGDQNSRPTTTASCSSLPPVAAMRACSCLSFLMRSIKRPGQKTANRSSSWPTWASIASCSRSVCRAASRSN